MVRLLFCLIAVMEASAVEYVTEETVAASCSLKLSVEVKPAAETDVAGEALITARLIDRSGSPVAGQEVALTATQGTFLCEGDTEGEDRSCFTTGDDGTAKIRLINLPFNRKAQIKAASQCGDNEVYGWGSVGISRQVVRKKRATAR